jgi:hypothetical protein
MSASNKGFYALYDSDEVDCGHPVAMGDHIGYSDEDELLCKECFREEKADAVDEVVDEFATPGLLEQWSGEV